MSTNAWQHTPIGELFDIGAGKSVTPAARLGEPKYPFLRTANVLWGRIDLAELDSMFFSETEIQSKSLEQGDLLVCEGGDIGRAAIWDGQVEHCGFQNHLHRLRRKRANVVPAFFMYYLQAGFSLLGLYEGAGNRTTIPNLSRNRLAALEVPLPPPLEQQRVTATLRTVQRAAEAEEQLLATVRELKHSVMCDLFSSGLNGEAQRDTEIGPVPQSWAVVPIGKHLTKAQYGLSVRGNPVGSFPILRMNCQEDGKVVFRDLQFVDLDAKVLAAFRVNDGDLLFNRTNSFELVGRTSVFRSEREAVFASYLIRLALDQAELHPEFVNYFLGLQSAQRDLKKLASRGVSQANISASKLRDFLIPKPPSLEEQRDIAAIIGAIDTKLSIHERKRAVLHDLFRTLLYELMTGRIRVANLDIDVSEVTAA